MSKSLGTLPKDLPITIAVIGVADLMAVLSKFPSTGAAVAICMIVGLLPLFILAPHRWSGRISEKQYLHEGRWLICGLGAYLLVAPINKEAITAVVLGTASVYYVFAGRFPWRRYHVDRQWLLTTVAGCTLAGIYADSLKTLGWHTLTYACFGASAFMALSAAVNSEDGKAEPSSLNE